MDALRRAYDYARDRFVLYAVKFGTVGLIGLVIDLAIFNFLRVGGLGDGHVLQSALGAKIASTTVAFMFNWVGNRFWTFRDHRRLNVVREFFEYVVVSLGGLAIGLLCLWVSRHVLGHTSLLADNIAANVVGLGLGTIFRFVLYRYWVYGHHRTDTISGAPGPVEQAEWALFVEPDHPQEGR
ncbi:MAG: GtrA family protein [Aeromicrobium sp.]|nr:GtrA family protein [Aeromicrobium sp.]